MLTIIIIIIIIIIIMIIIIILYSNKWIRGGFAKSHTYYKLYGLFTP